MQRNRLALSVLGLLVSLVATLFIACGGNGTAPQITGDNGQLPGTGNDSPLPGEAEPAAGSEQESAPICISLAVPNLGELAAGAEFDVDVSFETTAAIHQGVLRLSFDSASMVPVEAVPGKGMPGGMLRIADLDNSGFLPLAFTALPGAEGIRPGTGSLYSIRFRLTQPGSSAGRIGFSGDPEFLQLRDESGQRLQFDLETSAGGSHASN